METFPPPIKLEPLPPKRSARTSSKRPSANRAAKADSLKALRERNGVTLEQIAESTCIPIRHLADLEAGDVSNWPAGVYAKSWAREYATEAGIDPERVIALVAPVAQVEPTIEEIKQVREERDRMVVDRGVPLTPMVLLMRKIAAVAIVLALIALAALYFWQGSRPDANDPAPAAVGTSGAGGEAKPLR